MYKKFGILSLIMLSFLMVQDSNSQHIDTNLYLQKVAIVQDTRIENFYNDLEWLKAKDIFSEGATVYKLQILNTAERLEALDIKKDMEEIAADLVSEIVFREPYYKVLVGTFKNLEQAEIYREKINIYYNYRRAIVIVPEVMLIEDFLKQFYKR